MNKGIKIEELDPSEVNGDIYIWTEPDQNKTFPVTYECELCGRKKTVRFKEVPTPASYGTCPRCKKGTLYSQVVLAGSKSKEEHYLKYYKKENK